MTNAANKSNKSYSRLFLATPDCFDLPELLTALKAAISGGDIASLLIRQQSADKLKEAAMAVTKLAQDAGIAVLIDDDVELALACGADGVQITSSRAYAYTREKMGNDKIVGVNCQQDRHGAMSAGEAGADYVVFDNLDDAAWWAKVFEVPCVFEIPIVRQDQLPISQAREGVASMIDFICPPLDMWASEVSARETVQQFNDMIGETDIANA